MTELKFAELYTTISTVQESAELIKELNSFASSLFTKGKKIEEKMENLLSYDVRDKLLKVFEDEKVDLDKPNDIEELIEAIVKEIKKLPVIRLDIAVKPTKSNISHISDWLEYNMKQKFLIDLTVRRELIGGAIIGSEGRLGDYSLKHKLEEKVTSDLQKQTT